MKCLELSRVFLVLMLISISAVSMLIETAEQKETKTDIYPSFSRGDEDVLQ